MYFSLLNQVTNVINKAVRAETQQERVDGLYNYMFNPEAYAKQAADRARKERLANRLVAVATATAAIGEVVHLAKRSGVIDKIVKK